MTVIFFGTANRRLAIPYAKLNATRLFTFLTSRLLSA